MTARTAEVSTDTLRELRWEKIRNRTLDLCLSKPGRKALAGRPFLTDRDALRREQRLVSQMKAALDLEGPPPLEGVAEVDEAVRRARKDGVLDVEELFAVAETLRSAMLMRLYAGSLEKPAPELDELIARLPVTDRLREQLVGTFEADGSVRDDASPRLQELRAQIASLHTRLRTEIDGHLKDREILDVLQDDYYTLREERYVLPVKASFQGQVPGIVHGSSNSGQTVYIEPEELIRTNNQLKLAEQEAEREIWRIRKECSEAVAAEGEAVCRTASVLAELDSVAARAALSLEIDAVEPVLTSEGPARLRAARNIFLLSAGVDVVPNDVLLGDGFRVLIITGPNTGGKTVTLSTLGICALMAQAGYHIPAAEGSELPVYEAIHSLMGDAQSIERGLSTFSGHLDRLHAILEAATPTSLVLLDEIVVGTEPAQGSALAVAFLEAFAEKGASVAVTTHYDRLKTLQYADERFRNASVGFDTERMQPNYRLAEGLPGASSPIEVATRLGIDASVVERAREVVGAEALNLDAVIRDLETERDRLGDERAALEKAREAADRERERHEAAVARVRRDGVRMAREACRETLELTDKLRKELQTMRKDLRGKRTTVRELEEKRREVRKAEDRVRDAIPPDPDAPPEPERRPLTFDELNEGMTVFVRSFKAEGHVAERPSSPKRISVVVGGLRTTVSLDQLATPDPSEPADAPAAKRRQASSAKREALPDYDERTPPPKVSDNTCDLRGLLRDESLTVLEKALDDCLTHEQPVLWIVHGHGTGVLKQAVRDHLASSRFVAHFRPGDRNEGGDGVTLAWIDL